MADRIAKLAETARALSREEQMKLADVLLHNIDAEEATIDTAWLNELHGRIEAAKRGETEKFDADAVMAELRRKT